MADWMADIESVLQETRVFPPPESFAQAAHIHSLGEYRALYDESRRGAIEHGEVAEAGDRIPGIVSGIERVPIENDDPHGQRFARMKKSDDATALLVRVAP